MATKTLAVRLSKGFAAVVEKAASDEGKPTNVLLKEMLLERYGPDPDAK